MVVRTEWLRLRRQWVCFGLGTVCATGLTLSGCSRTPMARFREMTSAPAEEANAATETRSAASERPATGDPVAATRSEPSEGRVTIVGDGAKRNAFQRYREGYADLGNRLLNREQPAAADPFLEAGVDPQSRDFPATDVLAPGQRSPGRSPALDDSVARADLRPDRSAAIGTASLQRSSPTEGVARTTPPQSTTSRLEQLKAELRAQREGVATLQSAAPPRAPDSDRGTVLSGPTAAEGVARVNREPAVERPSSSSTDAATASVIAAEAAPVTGKGPVEDTALRVQSMLASAEWLADRGDLEEAYRNAILAQHLAEYAGLTFDPRDRQPAEVSQRIWEAIQARESSSELALNLPKPQPPSGPARQPVPRDAFPGSDRASWQPTPGGADLVPLAGALPVIAPQGTVPPVLAAPGPAAETKTEPAASPAPAPEPAAAPAAAELPQVAQAPAANPVTLAKIDAAPAATPGVPAGAAPAVATASPTPAAEPPSGIVTALAESPQQPRPETQTALTVPAMAALPKVARPLPVNGPSLGGPQLAQAEPAAAPPLLDVVGARQLPAELTEETTPARSRRIYWILGGLTVLLLGAAYAFRRRWSAGASRAK